MSNVETQSSICIALRAFHVGMRVQAHPATDTWMKGDRYGNVVEIGSKFVHVRMDVSCRTLRFHPENLIIRPE